MKRKIPIYFWFPVVGCIAGGTFFMNIAPVADQFMKLFGVGYAGLSVFISIISWSHSFFQMPGGLVVDRAGVTRALSICLVVMIIANLVPFAAPESLPLAIAMKALLGLVTGSFFMAMIKIIKILTPPVHIARMQGMHGAAFCLGTLIPYFYLPPTGAYGWTASYLTGVLFCCIVGLCMFCLPLDRLRETKNSETFSQMLQAVKKISTSKTFWVLGCGHGFFYGTINNFGTWLPTILTDITTNSSPADWATATGVLLFVGTLGRIFGSEIIGRLTRWQIISHALPIIGITYWLLAFCADAELYLGICLVLAVLCGLTFASVFTLIIDVAAPAYVFVTMGFVNMLANVTSIIMILLWGTLREYTGNFSAALCISGTAVLVVWHRSRRCNPEKKHPTDTATPDTPD